MPIFNRILGDRTENLEIAIAYLESALQIYTKQAFPELWANTQNTLAAAYQERIRGDRAENMEKAIIYCQAALEVRTFEVFPHDWAQTQMNLANAYRDRIVGNLLENLLKAIVHYKASLQVLPQVAFPEPWAIVQNNLGMAYSKIPQSEFQERAIAAFEAALQVYTTNSDTHIFVVQQNQITLHTCTLQGMETLQNWIFQNWLLPYISDRSTWESQINIILGELSQRLELSKLISQHLQGIEELILVPHHLLHQIPFAALPISPLLLKEGLGERFLGDKFLIRHTPSCQILEFCHQRYNLETHEKSLKYGTVEDAEDNLPCASFEGEQIANLYNIPPEKRLIGKTQATRKNYRQLVQQVHVLHSCHHAQSRLDNPLESELKLGDGSITLGQLMSPGWRLPNLLDVFLSCCETNLGNPSLNDDILTLSTGFLCAGARSVVSTLWVVDDLATALFSIFYYQQRQAGKSRPQALQEAQIKLRQLRKEDLLEISQQWEAKEKELIRQRKQYQYKKDSPQYLNWESEYKKCAVVTRRINAIKNSPEELPFSHPRYWAAFTRQGLG
jgi:CHAT domain-containing protein